MAEEIQYLIDQIQKEGVDQATKQAEEILGHAKERAAKMVSEAEAEAASARERAEEEAKAFAERSVKTLEQAARNLLITVGQGCEKMVTETLGRAVGSAVGGKLLPSLISKAVESGGGGVELSVSEADLKSLTSFCTGLASSSGREIELKADNDILSGFRIGFKGKNAYLDYSGEAIAEALALFLRPELAKTVNLVAREALESDVTEKKSLRLNKNRKYIKKSLESIEDAQLAPQAEKLADVIMTSEKESWTEPEMHKLVRSIKGLSEKQANWKIFQHYRKSLVDAGILVVET